MNKLLLAVCMLFAEISIVAGGGSSKKLIRAYNLGSENQSQTPPTRSNTSRKSIVSAPIVAVAAAASASNCSSCQGCGPKPSTSAHSSTGCGSSNLDW